MNETNETQGPPEEVPGESAQFDARLMTAIQTLETLTEIAPDEESEASLEEALGVLRGVQNSTDTASLGQDEVNDTETNLTENETETNLTDDNMTDSNLSDENLTENDTELNETELETSGEETEEQEEEPSQEAPVNSGSQGGGPPGFVSGLIGGLFG
jgi:hypothetical protein